MRVNTYVVYVHWWKTCKEPTICTYFRVMDKSLSPTAPTQSFWRWLSTVVYEIPILEKRIKYRSSKFPDILVCLLSDVDSLTEEITSCHALCRHRWPDEITMGGFEEGSCWLTTHVNLVILYPSVYLWQFQPSSSLEDGQIRKSSREQSPFSCQLTTSSLKTQIWDERNALPWKDRAWALRTT